MSTLLKNRRRHADFPYSLDPTEYRITGLMTGQRWASVADADPSLYRH